MAIRLKARYAVEKLRHIMMCIVLVWVGAITSAHPVHAQTPPTLVHVANNAALQAAAPSYGVVVRDGFTTAGDGGAATYIYSSSACSIAGGDNGSQVQSTSGGCWRLDPAAYNGGVSVKIWGAKDDDSTPAQDAFNAGWKALALAGGGRLTVPATTGCFKLTAAVVVTAPRIELFGEPGNCIDRGSATGHLIQLGNSSTTSYADLKATGLYFKNSTIASSASAEVSFFNAPNGRAERINCQAGGYYCLSFDANGPYYVADLYASADGQAAVSIGCLTGLSPADVHIDGADIAYQHRSAFEFCNAGGVTISGVNTDFNTHAIWAHPNAGAQVAAVYVTNSFFDFSTQQGILADGTSGRIAEWVLDDTTWIATCGSPVPAQFAVNLVTPLAVDPTADCLYITGASPTSNLVADNVWRTHIMHAARNGVWLASGVNNQLGNVSARNCDLTSSDTTCGGLKVLPGVGHWSWNGRAGGDVGDGSPNNQRYGVYISAGSGDYYAVSGDLSGNTNSALFDGATGTHKNLSGTLPGVPWSNYGATVTSVGGTITSASVSDSSYVLNGSTVTFAATLTVNTNGSGSGSLAISLPISPTANGLASARNQTTGVLLSGIINSGQAVVYVQQPNGSYPVTGDGQSFTVTGSYQAVAP